MISELRLLLLKVLDGAESTIAVVLNHLLGLPVSCDDSTISSAHRRHLKSEKVHVGLDSCLSHFISTRIVDAAVAEETAREATEDYDLLVGDLYDASALALCESVGGNIDDLPGVLTM